jgi:hypothetical protein
MKRKRKVSVSVRVPVKISPSAGTKYRLSSGEEAYMIGGTLQAVLGEIELFKQAGLDHLICYFGNEPYPEVASQASLFGREVIPSFK